MKLTNHLIAASVSGALMIAPAFASDEPAQKDRLLAPSGNVASGSVMVVESKKLSDQVEKPHTQHGSEGENHSEEREGHGQSETAGDGGHEEKKSQSVSLSQTQLREAAVTIQPLQPVNLPVQLKVPGEVHLDQYKTRIITPRISAMALNRQAVMGQMVRKGDILATLFSVEMAQAQGAFIVASTEWKRVQNIGEKIVSEKRSTQARVNFQQAEARLIAYGLTPAQIKALATRDTLETPGQFDMIADRDGLIVTDDFLIGQVIEPGTPIYKLTDPSSKWVEARISPSEARRIRAGTVVKIEIADQVIDGNVIQIEQQVDEKTRTLGVRIEVIDLHRELRPGQFVNVTLSGSAREDVLALPKKAVLRGPDGDWTVFRQVSPDKFEPVEIRVIRESGDMVVFDGIPSGTKVVTSGAFFVQSELAKSGFSVHNH